MQFDDIKKQLPFTISDADNEYLGLIGSYLRSPTRAIEHIYNEVARASNMVNMFDTEVCHYALKHEGDDSGAVASLLFDQTNKLYQLARETKLLSQFIDCQRPMPLCDADNGYEYGILQELRTLSPAKSAKVYELIIALKNNKGGAV